MMGVMMSVMMSPTSAAAWWLLQAPMTPALAVSDSVALCFRDAVTQAPVVGVTVREERAASRVLTSSCGRVSIAGVVRVARIGYEPKLVATSSRTKSFASFGIQPNPPMSTSTIQTTRRSIACRGSLHRGADPEWISPLSVVPVLR